MAMQNKQEAHTFLVRNLIIRIDLMPNIMMMVMKTHSPQSLKPLSVILPKRIRGQMEMHKRKGEGKREWEKASTKMTDHRQEEKLG